MYEQKAHQATFFEDATLFGGVRLNPENRWVRMSRLIPWAVFETQYAALFTNPREGKPAKSARMAIGALIIKKRYGFSDEDTVEEIRENPYLQYFLGFAEYTNARAFDPSVMTWFRERITTEMLAEVNDYIIGRKTMDDEEVPAPNGDDDDDGRSGNGDEPGNRGTLILDATCCPQNIRYPTDASLLNESRELLEGMIDTAHQAGATGGQKPRTYRNLARRDWLRFVRDRKPNRKKVRKALRQQLGYVNRDLGYLESILAANPDALSAKQLEYLAVIRKLYEQQREMYENNTHRVDDRIVSLHQPWVRPIVRGKTAVAVEFGAKVALAGGIALPGEIAKQGDVPVAQGNQLFHRQAPFPPVVHADRGDVRALQVVGLDGGVDLGQLQAAHLLLLTFQAAAQKDNPLQPPLQEQLPGRQNLAGFLVNDFHDELKARAPPLLQHLLGQVGQEGIAAAPQDDADGGDALLLKVAGALVAHIVELFDHAQHPGPGASVHVLPVVEHPGHRGNAHTGGPGHILDGHNFHSVPPACFRPAEKYRKALNTCQARAGASPGRARG